MHPGLATIHTNGPIWAWALLQAHRLCHSQQATMWITDNGTHSRGIAVLANSRGCGVQGMKGAGRTLTGINSAAAVKLTPLPSLKKSGGVELERMGASAGGATRSALCRADSCAGGLPRLTAPARTHGPRNMLEYGEGQRTSVPMVMSVSEMTMSVTLKPYTVNCHVTSNDTALSLAVSRLATKTRS